VFGCGDSRSLRSHPPTPHCRNFDTAAGDEVLEAEGASSQSRSQLERLSWTAAAAELLGDELSAGSLGCGDDLVEALITAQRIPARIEAEIAVCRSSWDRHDNFELLAKLLVRRFRRGRRNEFLEARIIPERVEHRIELENGRSKRHYDAPVRHREYFL
jgi:hypothetical protein